MTTVEQRTLEQVPGYQKLKDELALIEEEVVLGYTLADAIREGARHTNQHVGGFVNVQRNEVCALSAAALAAHARFGNADT